jgi:putative endonuclease
LGALQRRVSILSSSFKKNVIAKFDFTLTFFLKIVPFGGFFIKPHKNMSIFKTKSTAHLSLGARGEKAAENYLLKCGYKILAVNFANKTGRRLGEIDIIAKDRKEIVFVEVKTRDAHAGGSQLPEENITASKLYKLNKAASFYILKNKLTKANYRFDAITLLADQENNTATLRHLKNIFI